VQERVSMHAAQYTTAHISSGLKSAYGPWKTRTKAVCGLGVRKKENPAAWGSGASGRDMPQ
jgi:hypothetical protein